MVQLSEKLKYEIIIKKEMGLTATQIAIEMNINIKTVLKWISRYKNQNTIENLPKKGRNKKITDEFDKNIIECVFECISKPILSNINDKLQKRNIHVSISSLRNRLKDKNILNQLEIKTLETKLLNLKLNK